MSQTRNRITYCLVFVICSVITILWLSRKNAPAPATSSLDDFMESFQVEQIEPQLDTSNWTCPVGSGGYMLVSYKPRQRPPAKLEGWNVVSPRRWLLSWTFHSNDGAYVPLEGVYTDKFFKAGVQFVERSMNLSDAAAPIRIWQAPQVPALPAGQAAFWSRIRMPEITGTYKCVIKLYPTTSPSVSSIRDYGPSVVIKEIPVNVIGSESPVHRAASYDTAGPGVYLPGGE